MQKLCRPSSDDLMIPPAERPITKNTIQIGVTSRPNMIAKHLFGMNPAAQPQMEPRIVTQPMIMQPINRWVL